MKMRIPDSPLKRTAAAIGAAVVIMVAIGLVYLRVWGDTSSAKIDGRKIVAAGNA